jgi:hypothetical protein
MAPRAASCPWKLQKTYNHQTRTHDVMPPFPRFYGMYGIAIGAGAGAARIGALSPRAVAAPNCVDSVNVPCLANMLSPQPWQLLTVQALAFLQRPHVHAPFALRHLRHSVFALKFM